MKYVRTIVLITLLAGSFALPGAAQESRSYAPQHLYGSAVEFDVLRKGKKVGSHRTSFQRENGRLIVTSEMEIQIKLLFFTAYRSHYRAIEEWRDGVLTALDVRIDDNGTIKEISGRKVGEKFTGKGPNGAFEAALPVFPTNHWNSAVLERSRVLNTLTGEINEVSIEPRGVERIETANGTRQAVKFAYSGGFEAQVWYDMEGRWVKLAFTAKDDSPFEYICTSCNERPGT